jgi:hypothetical protein
VAERRGHIDNSTEQGRWPLAMSRHRFLMLGASIVGVGMLPFAQRNYAYAQGFTVTPLDYAKRKGMDDDDHTAILHDMFFDRRLKAFSHFHLPPCPNGEGWMVEMGPGFATFPVKSDWMLTGSTLADGTTLDHTSSLYRKGAVVHTQKMFENTDTELGNDNITFKQVYVKGQKHDWAASNGGYFDIDQVSTFLRISQHPAAASDRWNNTVKFVACEVRDWPGVSCDFRQLRNFVVSDNRVISSHRGSLIFRFGAHIGNVHHNHVLDGGDDCIAFNGNSVAYYNGNPDRPPSKAQNVYVWRNILSEKQTQDIPEPPHGRKRTGNSPIAVRGGENIHIGESRRGKVLGNEILYTADGYTDVDGLYHPEQPAVEVIGDLGQSARNIWVKRLIVRQTKAGALVVPSADVTGGVYDSVCDLYTGSSCAWQLAPTPELFQRSTLAHNGADSACAYSSQHAVVWSDVAHPGDR